MTIYGSGLRLSEAANLRIKDIDSKNMRILVRQGKGNKDRYALLPKKTLLILREYFKAYSPKDWLFINKRGERIAAYSIQNAFQSVVRKSGIPKHITIHTLRHYGERLQMVSVLIKSNKHYAIYKNTHHFFIYYITNLRTPSSFYHLTNPANRWWAEYQYT